MTKRTPIKQLLLLAALAGTTVVATGCSTATTRNDRRLADFFETPKWMPKAPWSKSGDEPPEPYPNPVKMASTWTPDVLVQSGRTPTRGFGGRLFFFDEKTQAVPVEGTLTVHGFEAGRDGTDSKIRPFKFTPEQFTQHFSQSDFGASYSVWIPWDAVGGSEKRISLVPTFKTTTGKVVQGSPATVILPGRREDQAFEMPAGQVSQRFQTHRDAVVNAPARPSGLVTTTIRRHATAPDGTSSTLTPSLRERAAAIAASQRSASGQEAARYIDVARVPQTPSVMAASAEMPIGVTAPSAAAAVQRAPRPRAVPRRIEMPTSDKQ